MEDVLLCSVNVENEVFIGAVTEFELQIIEARQKERRLTQSMFHKYVRKLSCTHYVDLVPVEMKDGVGEYVEKREEEGSEKEGEEERKEAEECQDCNEELTEKREELTEKRKELTEKRGEITERNEGIEIGKIDEPFVDDFCEPMEIDSLDSPSPQQDIFSYPPINPLLKMQIEFYGKTRKLLNFLRTIVVRYQFVEDRKKIIKIQRWFRKRKREREQGKMEGIEMQSIDCNMLDEKEIATIIENAKGKKCEKKELSKVTLQNTAMNSRYQRCELHFEEIYLDMPAPPSPSAVLKEKLTRKREMKTELPEEEEENAGRRIGFLRDLQFFPCTILEAKRVDLSKRPGRSCISQVYL